MRVNIVSPSDSIQESINVIESNTGVDSYIPEMASVASKESIRQSELEKGMGFLDTIVKAETKRSESLANYDVMNNLEIKSFVDITSLDLTSEFDVESVDLEGKGLPNPEDYGLTRTEVMNLSGVNGESWDLPRPKLSSVQPDCFDLGDMYLSHLVDLSFLDMRGWKMPTFDFSFANDWDFPDWIDSSNVDFSHLWDISDIDLSGIINLSEVSLPDWINPKNWDIDWNVDLSMEWDGLSNIFSGMGFSGDLLGMGSLASQFNGIRCVSRSIADICDPSSIVDAVANLSIPSMDGIMDGSLDSIKDKLSDLGNIGDLGNINGLGNIGDFISDMSIDNISLSKLDNIDIPWDRPTIVEPIKSVVLDDTRNPVLSALSYLGNDWYWYDKPTKRYDHDVLVRISNNLLECIKDSDKYKDLYAATVGAKAIG